MLSETIKKWKADWRREGLREGRREGRERGRNETEVAILLRQLRARFGRLPAGTRQRVTDASSVQRNRWSMQLLNAQRLEEVFEDATRSQ